MIKRLSNVFCVIVLALIFFTACADLDTPQNEVSLNKSMDVWMKKHYPDIPMIDSGLYYKVYENHDTDDTTTVALSSYVDVVVDGRLLDGSYFINSDPKRARQMGTFSYYTHYIPFRYMMSDYASYSFTNLAISAVLYNMQAGDSAVIFSSPSYSYGDEEATVSTYEGFGGSTTYISGDIGHYNIRLDQVNNIGDTLPLIETAEYAQNIMGLQIKDSVKKGLYLIRTDSLGGGNFLGSKDTTLTLRYKGYFIDGFVFDTNIESVAKENNIYNYLNSYATLEYSYTTNDDEDDGLIEAFRYVIPKLKNFDKATFITYPGLAYGSTGSMSTVGTLIFPNTPIIFDIEIVDEDE